MERSQRKGLVLFVAAAVTCLWFFSVSPSGERGGAEYVFWDDIPSSKVAAEVPLAQAPRRLKKLPRSAATEVHAADATDGSATPAVGERVLPFKSSPDMTKQFRKDPLRFEGIAHHTPLLNVTLAVQRAVEGRKGVAVGCSQGISSAVVDVRVCLDGLMPLCRRRTTCPYTANQTSNESKAGWSPPNGVSPHDASHTSSLFDEMAAKRLQDAKHTRVHYFCDKRDAIRTWNVSFLNMHSMCHSWNDTAEMESASIVAAQRGGGSIEKQNATLALLLKEKQWMRENCTAWLAAEAIWMKFAASSLGRRVAMSDKTSAADGDEQRTYRRRYATFDRLRPLANGTRTWREVDNLMKNATSGPDTWAVPDAVYRTQLAVGSLWETYREWISLHWADGLMNEDVTNVANNERRPNAALLHEAMLHGWFRREDVFQTLKLHGLQREAYARFRAKLKRQKQDEERARRADVADAMTAMLEANTEASNESLNHSDSSNPIVNATPVPEAMDDMLGIVDVAGQDGCDRRLYKEVRIGFVGDSLTMAYPRRIVQWIRRMCSSCDETELRVHMYNFAVSAKQVVDNSGGFRRTKMFTKSIRYDPDVLFLMLGTNDGLRYWYLSTTLFEASLEDIISGYLSLPARPHVVVMTPPPAFDSIYANHTQAGTKKRRGRTYERRVGYANAASCRLLGGYIVPTIRNVVGRMQQRPESRGRLHLVDFYQTALEWILQYAANRVVAEVTEEAVALPQGVIQRHAISKLSGAGEPPAGWVRTARLAHWNDSTWEVRETPSHKLGHDPSLNHLRGLPLHAKAVQTAIFTGLADAVHMDKPLQKIVAVEVLRRLFDRV